MSRGTLKLELEFPKGLDEATRRKLIGGFEFLFGLRTGIPEGWLRALTPDVIALDAMSLEVHPEEPAPPQGILWMIDSTNQTMMHNGSENLNISINGRVMTVPPRAIVSWGKQLPEKGEVRAEHSAAKTRTEKEEAALTRRSYADAEAKAKAKAKAVTRGPYDSAAEEPRPYPVQGLLFQQRRASDLTCVKCDAYCYSDEQCDEIQEDTARKAARRARVETGDCGA